MASTGAQVAGSAARASQSSPRWRSSSSRIGPPSQVGRWTPFVTCPIGTSAGSVPGHRSFHMSRATSPWRRLTPFAARLARSASWLIPNGSPSSSGRVRPRAISSAESAPRSRVTPASASSTCAGGYVSLPAGTGVWVVKIVRSRSAPGSSDMNAACPSLRCTSPGSIPSAASARVPPTPSRTYCASRASGSPMYRRDVIQRAGRSFSGRSASSRKSGTRPTSTRQICAVTVMSRTGTVMVSGSPSAPVTSAAGRRSGSVSTQYSCCQPPASMRWRK